MKEKLKQFVKSNKEILIVTAAGCTTTIAMAFVGRKAVIGMQIASADVWKRDDGVELVVTLVNGTTHPLMKTDQ